MGDVLKAIGGVVAAIVIVFFLGILGVLGGIFGGWIVGLFFTDLIIGTIARIGVDTAGLEVWHIGGTLGFIGAYFKSVQTNTNKSAQTNTNKE